MFSLTDRSRPDWCLDNDKIYKYAIYDQNMLCDSRVISIFTKRSRPAKMMLDEASSPFCIPVAEQC